METDNVTRHGSRNDGSGCRHPLAVGLGILTGAVVGAAWWIYERRKRPVEAAALPRKTKLRHARTVEDARRLTGTIAEELTNDLGVIHGNCELAKMKNPDDELLGQRMDAAMECATEATASVRELLAFSQCQ